VIRQSAIKQNWELMLLGDVCKTTSGGTPRRSVKAYFQGDIPWVKSGELPDGLVQNVGEYISEEAVSNSSAKVFPAGTLLIALYGATVGKLGILTFDAASNQAVCAIFPKKNIEPKYLYWHLRNVRSDLIKQAIGGAQPNISQGILRNIPVPVAPIDQQKRIVEEIEKQVSRLDEAVTNLKRVKTNLKRYKASVLQAAVTGKLTEEWRKQQAGDVEPVSKLLEQILTERRQKWEETELARLREQHARGQSKIDENWQPKNDKWKEKYKEPSEPNTLGLPELPITWVWTTTEQVSNATGGLTQNKKREQYVVKMPFLRVANVYANELRLDNVLEIGVLDTELKRVILKKGDLLVVEGNGSPDQIGRLAIWDDSVSPCVHQNHLIKVRLLMPEMGKLVLYWLLSLQGRQCIKAVANSTTGLYTLSISKVSSLPSPLAPLKEQQRIIEEVESRLSVAEKIERTVDANLKRAERLRQSILKQAFSGKLV